MTDAQVLQNLLAVYESMVTKRMLIFNSPVLKEVIAELRRRGELEDKRS